MKVLSKDRVIYAIYFIGFLDLFGVSMIIPLLPRQAKDLGASPTLIGILGSVYGGLQLFSSPVVGRWSDHAGRRLVLLACLLMSALGYGLLAVGTSIIMLFVARIPSGMFKHGQDISRAYISDLLPQSQHAQCFGRFNAISSIGFIVGPTIGGHIADLPGGFYLCGSVAAAIFLLCAGLFKHTHALNKCLVDDVCGGRREQVALLGRYNAISTMGYIVGPILGGHMLDGPQGPFWVCLCTVAVFVTNAVVVWLFIPNAATLEAWRGEKVNGKTTSADEVDSYRDGTPENDENDVKKSKLPRVASQLSFRETVQQMDWHNLWDIFLIRFLMGFAIILYRSNFSLMLDLKYEASGKNVGYIISYSGLIGTFSGFVVGHIARYYNNDAKLLLHTGIAQVLTILALTFAPSLTALVIALAPLSLANAVARVCMTNLTIKRGGHHDIGALLGLGASVLSVARMLSPFIAGVAQEVHINGPGIVGSVFASLGVAIMQLSPIFLTSKPKQS